MSRAAESGPPPGIGHRFGAVSFLAVAITVALVSFLLWQSWDEVREGLVKASPIVLLAGWLLATVSTLTAFLAFAELCNAVHRQPLPLTALGHLYFTAQLMKHLPGRVWGVAYQGVMTRGRIPMLEWVAINIGYLALSTYFALLFALVVVLAWVAPWLGAMALLLGIALLALAWRPWAGELVVKGVGLISRRGRDRLHGAVRSTASVPRSSKIRFVWLSLLGWALYAAAWSLYGAAYPELGAAAGIHLSASYTLAWVIGYLSLVTPSGIGVRELIFAGLSIGYPTDIVLYGMLIGRAGLLATDLALGTVFWPYQNDARK
ncbi:hypothetical protein [Pseudomarimonas arenosa]|uniref:Flippase-like domain-containing protein n=1 Tax=Pseudomarimonas arenosa TaxID=2774145 RepID=A0AAW3ZGQ1_9GAMM|nr:hypothetical protein [Pseudomarimonas arenosa]MBD8524192.1 hypothetical protein [Pseudomarimonas arenosa]